MRVCVILPAAGSGRRFGSDKLAEDLGGQPVLIRSVELFSGRSDVDGIIVAGPADERAFAAFIDLHGAALAARGAIVVRGGHRERWETVHKALAAVPASSTHVAVHDAARPTAPRDLIDRVFLAASRHDAVIPGLAVSATLRRVGEPLSGDESPTVRLGGETVSRAGLVAVQTPQVFRRGLLCDAYRSLADRGELEGVTDDAQVVERYGASVIVVDGDARNIKVTTPDDAVLARAIMRAGWQR